MEKEVGVEGNDKGGIESSGIQKSSYDLAAPMGVADPIVYKLVRVDGNGRLVPATDDEVVEVEGLLEVEHSGLQSFAATNQIVQTILSESSLSQQLKGSGLHQSEKTGVGAKKLNARLEYIEEMLQKVKQEERLHLAYGSPDHSTAFVPVDNVHSDQYAKRPGVDEKLESETDLLKHPCSTVPCLNANSSNQSRITGECSKLPDGLIEGKIATYSVCTSSKPDFSKVKGEICLNVMSIKELHEVFKAMFGRDTTVKDKLWLKRRIAMGLTNSYDVPSTSFIIRDTKMVNTGKEECSRDLDNALIEDPIVKTVNVDHKDSAICSNGWTEDELVLSDKRLKESVDTTPQTEHHSEEQRAKKRVRRPTKRYIEELSEMTPLDEFGGKSIASAKCSALGLMSQKPIAKPSIISPIVGRARLTRLDFLGGSNFHIPCVSRIRRSRPRKNIMTLLKFHCNLVGMTANMTENSLRAVGSPHDGCLNKGLKTISASDQSQEPPSIVKPEKDNNVPALGTTEMEDTYPLENTADDNIAIAQSGMKRKHHRAWSLAEVMKLVEGVARYGAGKWSEIKRLVFASYTHRTSVDLKDKWRNLLKASLSQADADKGINLKKPASSTMLLPAPILLRVRELAEMQAQGPSPTLIASKLSRRSCAHETRSSGYL